MKSYDETISAVFDRIRTNEIENQRKRKMALKLITSLGCLCLVVAVCVGVWNVDFSSPSGDEKTPVDENIPKQDVFLSTSGESVVGESSSDFQTASEYGVGIGFAKSEYKSFDELKGKEKTAFKGSKTFIYNESRCTFKNSEKKEYGTFYCIYDEYVEKGVQTGERVEYLHGTDILVYYFKPTGVQSASDTLSEDTIRKISKEFVLKIISEKEFSNYSDGELVDSPTNYYHIKYSRYIHGYRTDDSIAIELTRTGAVALYSAPNFKKYEALESKLTKEKLDTAYEKLKNKIEAMSLKNLDMSDPLIVTSTTGEPFIRVGVTYDTSDEYSVGEYFYVNIH